MKQMKILNNIWRSYLYTPRFHTLPQVRTLPNSPSRQQEIAQPSAPLASMTTSALVGSPSLTPTRALEVSQPLDSTPTTREPQDQSSGGEQTTGWQQLWRRLGELLFLPLAVLSHLKYFLSFAWLFKNSAPETTPTTQPEVAPSPATPAPSDKSMRRVASPAISLSIAAPASLAPTSSPGLSSINLSYAEEFLEELLLPAPVPSSPLSSSPLFFENHALDTPTSDLDHLLCQFAQPEREALTNLLAEIMQTVSVFLTHEEQREILQLLANYADHYRTSTVLDSPKYALEPSPAQPANLAKLQSQVRLLLQVATLKIAELEVTNRLLENMQGQLLNLTATEQKAYWLKIRHFLQELRGEEPTFNIAVPKTTTSNPLKTAKFALLGDLSTLLQQAAPATPPLTIRQTNNLLVDLALLLPNRSLNKFIQLILPQAESASDILYIAQLTEEKPLAILNILEILEHTPRSPTEIAVQQLEKFCFKEEYGLPLSYFSAFHEVLSQFTLEELNELQTFAPILGTLLKTQPQLIGPQLPGLFLLLNKLQHDPTSKSVKNGRLALPPGKPPVSTKPPAKMVRVVYDKPVNFLRRETAINQRSGLLKTTVSLTNYVLEPTRQEQTDLDMANTIDEIEQSSVAFRRAKLRTLSSEQLENGLNLASYLLEPTHPYLTHLDIANHADELPKFMELLLNPPLSNFNPTSPAGQELLSLSANLLNADFLKRNEPLSLRELSQLLSKLATLYLADPTKTRTLMQFIREIGQAAPPEFFNRQILYECLKIFGQQEIPNPEALKKLSHELPLTYPQLTAKDLLNILKILSYAPNPQEIMDFINSVIKNHRRIKSIKLIDIVEDFTFKDPNSKPSATNLLKPHEFGIFSRFTSFFKEHYAHFTDGQISNICDNLKQFPKLIEITEERREKILNIATRFVNHDPTLKKEQKLKPFLDHLDRAHGRMQQMPRITSCYLPAILHALLNIHETPPDPLYRTIF